MPETHITEGEHQLQTFWKRANRLANAGALAGALGLYFLAPDGRALALGLLLGAMAGVARFRISYRMLRRADSPRTVVLTRLVGYGLSGGALLLAFLLPQTFSPWTTIPGLLLMNAAVVAAELLGRLLTPGAADATPGEETGA